MCHKLSILGITLILILSLACLSLISCEPAAKSAAQAFDNANSVIKSGSDVMFMPVEPTPTVTPAQ